MDLETRRVLLIGSSWQKDFLHMLYDSRSKLIASWGDGYYMTEGQPSVGILPEPPMIVTFFPCVGKKPSLHSLEQTLRIC